MLCRFRKFDQRWGVPECTLHDWYWAKWPRRFLFQESNLRASSKKNSINHYRNQECDKCEFNSLLQKLYWVIYQYITLITHVFLINTNIFLLHQMQTLYNQGGRNFWIHNTGPFGCLPQKLSLEQNKDLDPYGCISSYNSAARVFNEGLHHLCIEMRSELKDANVVYVDIYSIKYDLIANATKYGKLIVSQVFSLLHRLLLLYLFER